MLLLGLMTTCWVISPLNRTLCRDNLSSHVMGMKKTKIENSKMILTSPKKPQRSLSKMKGKGSQIRKKIPKRLKRTKK